MEEISRSITGIDVGTENVRAVTATVSRSGKVNIVGYNEGKNTGMRKGVVANISGPGRAMDQMLGEVERMSGLQVDAATVSMNGAHILTTRVNGLISVGMMDHEITVEDIARVEEVACTTGRIPANRKTLDVVPLNYAIDEQMGVKNPLGMTGSRLMMDASVISALTPNCENLVKAFEAAEIRVDRMVPSVVAAGKSVLTEKQRENGVAIVDFGAATTGVAIYEEGELQYVGVIPMGSNNVTNDLAIVLEVNTDVAEEIKRRHVSGLMDEQKDAVVKIGREEFTFDRGKINMVVSERLQEIFSMVRREIKMAGYDQRLPEGIILTGGGARMHHIEVFAKQIFEACVKIGVPQNFPGMVEAIRKPEYAAAIGLLLTAVEERPQVIKTKSGNQKTKKGKAEKGALKRFFSKF